MLTHLIGRPLIQLNFNQQRYEADFRFDLVRTRENSEQIALLRGETAERERLAGPFQPRGRQLVRHHEPHEAADVPHRQLRRPRSSFPIVVVSPAYFAGKMQLGG